MTSQSLSWLGHHGGVWKDVGEHELDRGEEGALENAPNQQKAWHVDDEQ